MLRRYSNVDFVSSWVRYFGEARGIWPTFDASFPYLLGHNTCAVFAVMRRSAFDRSGGWDPAFQYGLEDHAFWISMLAAGAIGRVLAARAHWGEYLPQWHPWEDYRQSYAARADLGGGVIRTLTHPLDYLRYLIGEVDELWSFNGHISSLQLDVEDVAEIGLKFKNGAIGGVHLNYVQRPPRHTLEIVGANGTLKWHNADGILHFSNSSLPFGSYSDLPPAPVVQTFSPPEGFERNQLFVAQTRHFLAVVRGEAEPICTLEDGVMALRLARAAYESQRTGRVVKIMEKA